MARPRTSQSEYVRPEQRMPEMVMLTEIPAPPQHPPLRIEGVRRWNWYCKMLLRNKRLAEPFLALIEEACRLHDELFDMRNELEKIRRKTNGSGMVINTSSTRKPNPLLITIQGHSKMLTKILNDLGCSPASCRNHNLPVNLPTDTTKKVTPTTASSMELDESDFE